MNYFYYFLWGSFYKATRINFLCNKKGRHPVNSNIYFKYKMVEYLTQKHKNYVLRLTFKSK